MPRPYPTIMRLMSSKNSVPVLSYLNGKPATFGQIKKDLNLSSNALTCQLKAMKSHKLIRMNKKYYVINYSGLEVLKLTKEIWKYPLEMK